MTRPGWDDYFLSIAIAVAFRADCTRRKVGCVIVDESRRVISTGYNGAPAGAPGCESAGACPRGKLTYGQLPANSSYVDCIALHAEANALLYAGQSCRGATAYITDQPCHECKRLMAGAGISRVVTRSTRGLELARESEVCG